MIELKSVGFWKHQNVSIPHWSEGTFLFTLTQQSILEYVFQNLPCYPDLGVVWNCLRNFGTLFSSTYVVCFSIAYVDVMCAFTLYVHTLMMQNNNIQVNTEMHVGCSSVVRLALLSTSCVHIASSQWQLSELVMACGVEMGHWHANVFVIHEVQNQISAILY